MLAKSKGGGGGSPEWLQRFGPRAWYEDVSVGDEPATNNPHYLSGYFPNPEDTGNPGGPRGIQTNQIGARTVNEGNQAKTGWIA